MKRLTFILALARFLSYKRTRDKRLDNGWARATCPVNAIAFPVATFI